MAVSALMSLTSNHRLSRLLTLLAFIVFIVFFFSRLHDSAPDLFENRKPEIPQQQPVPEYNGPRFELFGLPGFASEIELATLNIKIGADEPSQAITQENPGIEQPPQTGPSGTSQSRRGDGSPVSPVQQQLPIDLPKFAIHHLDAPNFNTNSLDVPIPGISPATVTIDLPPKRGQPDASKIAFGVATYLERMADNLRNFAHWGANTNARFIVVHEPRNTTLRPGEPTVDEVKQLYSEAGIDHLTLIEKDKGWGERFLSLLGVHNELLEPQTEWVALIDDDTFFFDMETVLEMLGKYDTSKPWYVGRLSENKWNINSGGLFAVGGAGIFISRPLIQTVGPFARSCFPEEGTEMGGDALVGLCIHRHTTTKISLEHGLYQLDIHGDVTGFYEAARPQPISVHHWKSWHHHDMPAIAAVAEKCGRRCVLQNFRFQDGWQMSNGFSFVRYGYNRAELESQHPEAMEHTWEVTIWDIEDSWTYSLAPLKERDAAKVQYLMEKTDVNKDDGTVTLYYVRREMGVGKSIIRVIWR